MHLVEHAPLPRDLNIDPMQDQDDHVVESHTRIESYKHDYGQHSANALEMAEPKATAVEAADVIFGYHKKRSREDWLNAQEADRAAKLEQADEILKRFRQSIARERPLDDEYRAKRKKLFSSLGFSEPEAKEVTRSWGSFKASRPKELGSEEDTIWQGRYNKIVQSNLEQIIELDNREPGSAVALFRTYGIRNFGRYNMFDLIRQYRGDAREPLHVWLSSAEDWSDSLNSNGQDAISTEAAEAGMDSPVFIEAATPIETFRRFLAVKQNFEGEISSVGVSAHGATESITLSRRSKLAAGDIESSKAIERLVANGTLTPDFSVILSACYGQKLAKEISKHTEGKVVAPGNETNGVYIDYSRSKEKIRHAGRGNVRIYQGGEHLTRRAKLRRLAKKILDKSGVRLVA